MRTIMPAVLAVTLLFLATSCEKTRKKQERDEALKDLQQSRREMTDDLKMTDEGLEVDFDSMEKHRKKVESAADKMGGKEGQALKIVAGFQVEINQLGKKHSEATASFAECLNWESLASTRDYEARRKVLNDYIALNEIILEKYRGFHQSVMSKLDEIGYRGAERAAFDKAFLKNRGKITELVGTIRQSDIDCSKMTISIIDRLEKLGEDWNWKKDEESIEFSNDEDAEWFNARMTDFEKLGERQLKAQQEFMAMMKGQ